MTKRTVFLLLLSVLLAPSVRLISAQDAQRPRTTTTAATNSNAATRSAVDAPRSLEELRSRIEQIVRQPALEPGFFAVKIVSLDTGTVIYEQDANKFVRPASNMKLYTVATAFDRLTPEFHFITSVYAKEKPDDGKVKGDLIIYGRGDPSIAARFNDGDYFKGINELADRIVAAGVRRVKGDVVGDESYFTGAPLGSGWEWEDLTWSGGAPVSALNINDNALDLNVKPSDRVGAPVLFTTGPPAASFVTILNHATTSARGSRSNLRVYRGLGANTIELSGTLPLGDAGWVGGVAIPDPALAFVTMLRDALVKRGVKIDGRVRTVNSRSAGSIVSGAPTGLAQATDLAQQSAPVEITSLQSPPFSVIATHTLKPSQNQYTELILTGL